MLDEPQPLFQEYVQKAILEADMAYRTTINRLWAANGGGIALVVSAVKSVVVARESTIPLGMFTVGLVSLAIGEIIDLLVRKARLRAIETAGSFLDLPASVMKRPSERIGLSIRHHQTICAIVSACFFLAGAVWSVWDLIAP